MDEYDLEKMGKQMNIEETAGQKPDDMQSVITQDRLKKFNEITGGYEENYGEDENNRDDDLSNPNEAEGAEENLDEVHSLKAKQQSVISQALLKSKLASRREGNDAALSVHSK